MNAPRPKVYRVNFYTSAGEFHHAASVRAGSRMQARELAEAQSLERYGFIFDSEIPAIYRDQ